MNTFDDVLIKRKRINDYITKSLNKNILIFSAPIGFGKTTAVQQFIESEDIRQAIWIFAKNNDERFIFDDFCVKFSKLKGSVARKIKKIGFPDTQDKRNAIADILSSDIKQPVCIVIKDFSMSIVSDDFCRFLRCVAGLSNITVIVITDDKLNNSFLELNFSDCCGIVDKETLIFNTYEIHRYMSLNGFFISETHAQEIFEITHGWIFLIKLIKKEYNLSDEDKDFPAAQEFAKQILYDSMSQELKKFVLTLLPLEEFNAEQAKFIIGQHSAYPEVNRLLEKETVFYKKTGENTYRMYPLVKNALMGEFLLQDINEEEIYEKCAYWMNWQHNYAESLRFYMKAGNKDSVMSILKEIKLTRDGKTLLTLKETFRFLGEDKYRYADFYMSCLVLFFFYLDDNTAIYEYERAREYYLSDENESKNDNRFMPVFYFTGALLKFNNAELMSSLAKKALPFSGEFLFKGSKTLYDFFFNVPSLIFVFYRSPGTLKQTVSMIKPFLNAYSNFIFGTDSGEEFLTQADYCILTGDYDNSEIFAKKALFKAKLSENYSIMLGADFVLLRLYMLKRTSEDCDRIISEINKMKKERKVGEANAELILGYYYACVGQGDKIADWICDCRIYAVDLPKKLRNISYIAMGMYLISQKKYLELEVFATMVREEYQKSGYYALGVIYTYIFSAIADMQNKNTERAMENLDRAINLSEFDLIAEPFINLSSEIVELFEKIAKANKFAKNILGNCKATKNILEQKKNHRSDFGFTTRENQVASLITEGFTQSEIAGKLYISLPTVKKHAQNIYKKLGVNTKSEAIRLLKANLK